MIASSSPLVVKILQGPACLNLPVACVLSDCMKKCTHFLIAYLNEPFDTPRGAQDHHMGQTCNIHTMSAGEGPCLMAEVGAAQRYKRLGPVRPRMIKRWPCLSSLPHDPS